MHYNDNRIIVQPYDKIKCNALEYIKRKYVTHTI